MAIIALVAACFVVPFIHAGWSQRIFKWRLRHRTTPVQLQAWATGVLAPYQTNTFDLSVEITNLPAMFQGYHKWPPHGYIFSYNGDQYWAKPIPYIKIFYGSAVGHFGVVICSTNLPKPPDQSLEATYTKWDAGIWFFDSQ